MKASLSRSLFLAFLVISTLALVGCGNKGDLVLPDPPKESRT